MNQGQFGGSKLAKQVYLDSSARGKLFNGINTLSEAVSSTLGAGGKTVLLSDDFGNPYITKDGVTVAKHITFEDPIEDMGATLVKEAASKTHAKAGDGTTTSTLLAQKILRNYDYKVKDESFRDVKTGMVKYSNAVISFLEEKTTTLDDSKLEEVIYISSNNDKELSDVISEAFISAGETGVVEVSKSNTEKTFVEKVEGTRIKSSSSSVHFHTDPDREICILENPLVFLSSSTIKNLRDIQDIMEFAIKNNRSILIVAEMENQPLSALAMNKVRGNVKVNVVSAPSFGLKRKDILSDLAILTGAKVYDESLGDSHKVITSDLLGQLQSCYTDREGTTFVVNEIPQEASNLIEDLKERLDKETHDELSRHYTNRLNILCGGVSIINVGSETEQEQKEKLDRVDDAVCAVKAAKKEGVLPGGGSTLHYAANNIKVKTSNKGEELGVEILKESLYSPFNKILRNAGLDPFDKKFNIKKWGYGVDVVDGKVKDMSSSGIIDPTLVTKEALKNALSVALTILSTDVVVSNILLKK